MDELENYRLQLQQVEAALIPEPNNEELVKMRDALLEVISLQEEMIASEQAESASKESKSSAAAQSSLSSEKKISWKVGDRCLAPSKNGQRYIAVIDGISQDKVAITFTSNGVKHMVRLYELRVAPIEEKKQYIFESNSKANKGDNGPKKEWQMERERRKIRAQKKEQRRKQLDEVKEQQKNSWLNFNNKASVKSLKGIKRIEASGSAADGPRTGFQPRNTVTISSRALDRRGGARDKMDSLF